MSKDRLVRVTCTLPADLVKATDVLATKEGRSRSWVVAEALRRHAAEVETTVARTKQVSEQASDPYAADFEESRRRRRDADLALTPEQRIQAVEEMAELARRVHSQPRFSRLVAFDTWEDYFAWKKKDVLA